MKEQILKLRAEGKSYSEIAAALGCNKATVSYHCNPQVKANFLAFRNKNRKKQVLELKLKFGGKCKRCNYSKCLDALHFHHIDPNEKTDTVSRLFMNKGKTAAHKEAEKCELICANCHAELHSD